MAYSTIPNPEGVKGTAVNKDEDKSENIPKIIPKLIFNDINIKYTVKPSMVHPMSDKIINVGSVCILTVFKPFSKFIIIFPIVLLPIMFINFLFHIMIDIINSINKTITTIPYSNEYINSKGMSPLKDMYPQITSTTTIEVKSRARSINIVPTPNEMELFVFFFNKYPLYMSPNLAGTMELINIDK